MSRVSLLGRLFPSSKSSAKLYLAVGTQAVYAGVYRQGAWQKQFAVKIGMVAGPTAGQGAAVDLLSDSLQSLKNRLLAFFAQQAKPIGRVELYVSVSGRWLSSETLPWSDAVRTVGLHAMATEHLEQSGCVLGAGDVVRWEDAPWGSPRWVVAYPFSVLQALQRLAAAVGG